MAVKRNLLGVNVYLTNFEIQIQYNLHRLESDFDTLKLANNLIQCRRTPLTILLNFLSTGILSFNRQQSNILHLVPDYFGKVDPRCQIS